MQYKRTQKNSFLGSVIEFVSLLLLVFLIRTVFFGLYQVPTGSMETTMLVGERFVANKFSYWIRKPERGEIIAMNDPEYTYSTNPLVALFEQYVWGPSNWTKRVIGIPGDIVDGKLEDGKPVVYLNNVKIDEPYLNKYPLVRVWTQDPQELKEQIEKELQAIMRGWQTYNQETLEQILLQKWSSKIVPRSYDPTKSGYDQPFYRMNDAYILRDEDGKPEMLWPATPVNQRASNNLKDVKQYWNKSDVFHVELGDNQYWCMGDNRLGSKDCRFFGPVLGENIHGRIVFCIASIDQLHDWMIVDLLLHPIDFWSRIRWSRCMRWIY